MSMFQTEEEARRMAEIRARGYEAAYADLQAENARLRAVVEAARAWVALGREGVTYGMLCESEGALCAAVRAYEEAQKEAQG